MQGPPGSVFLVFRSLDLTWQRASPRNIRAISGLRLSDCHRPYGFTYYRIARQKWRNLNMLLVFAPCWAWRPSWGHLERMSSLCWARTVCSSGNLGPCTRAQMNTPFLGHVRPMLGFHVTAILKQFGVSWKWPEA